MVDQIENWIKRGSAVRCFPRPLGPALEHYVSYFDKSIGTVQEALNRYNAIDGYLGLTVKNGELWGAIFDKRQADKAAVALGKAPGQTYRVSGLPIDMPGQELDTLLKETMGQFSDCRAQQETQ
eukprot:2644674-Amphidinium_carterae.1